MAQIPEPILRRIAAIEDKLNELAGDMAGGVREIERMRTDIAAIERHVLCTKRGVRVLEREHQALQFAVKAINGEIVDVEEIVGNIEVVDDDFGSDVEDEIEEILDLGSSIVGPPIELETVAINENTETVTPEPAPVEAASEPEPVPLWAKLSSIPAREVEQLRSDDVPIGERIVLAIRKLGMAQTGEIAEMVGKQPQQIGGTMGHLSRKNLIRRMPVSGAWALGAAAS